MNLPRMHLALKAYHELLLNLFEMDRSKDKAVRDSAKVIEGWSCHCLIIIIINKSIVGNVFYMMEYRDIFLIMLRKFDESRQSRCGTGLHLVLEIVILFQGFPS